VLYVNDEGKGHEEWSMHIPMEAGQRSTENGHPPNKTYIFVGGSIGDIQE
jgi:hypothetical protein